MQSRKKLLTGISALLVVALSMPARGDQTAIFAEVHHYADSMAQFEAGKSAKTLGEIYAKGRAVGQQLAPILESLSDSDFALADEEMKGFFVFREEVVGVEPEMTFFKKLADRKGTQEDRDFFGYMTEVYGSGTWPAYVFQQTDYSGCDSYGDGTRTRLYVKAIKIGPLANATYRAELNKTIGELRGGFVSDGQCVCDGADSVTKELTMFIEQAPNASFIGDVKDVLAKVKAGKSKMRFSCVSG